MDIGRVVVARVGDNILSLESISIPLATELGPEKYVLLDLDAEACTLGSGSVFGWGTFRRRGASRSSS